MHALLLAAVLVAGCGYKGPLYLPQPQQPPSAPAPATQEDDPERAR